MTKEEYLVIKFDVNADILPVLHLCFNHYCRAGSQMTIDEFNRSFSQWISFPFVMMNYSSIIEQTFLKADKIYGIE